jgi:outer membrane receptor for ferrienterochelin and colicins
VHTETENAAMSRVILYGILCVLITMQYSTFAQQKNDTLHGKVLLLLANGETEKPANGAKVQWLNGANAVVCNPIGNFSIPILNGQNTLIVSYKGFAKDTIKLEQFNEFIEIKLAKQSKSIGSVTVTAQKQATEISYLSTLQLLKINGAELQKAACCNLSESFETTPSVDVNFTDAITGQKQIQMLGLATPYTLITQENMPMIRGLASITGLNLTPGTWVQGMQLSKGTGSVVNGYESLAGQINVELQKPDAAEKVYFNVYQNTGGRSELNLNLNKKWNKHLSSGLLLHYKNQWYKQDMNGDGFMDNPLGTQAIALYRMQYFSAKGLEVQGGVKVSVLDNSGGQIASNGWQYNSGLDRLESWLKIGKVYKAKPWKSMGLQLASFAHSQDVATPQHNYVGSQTNFYSNFIYQNVIGNTNHSYKIGASYLWDDYTETLPDTVLGKLKRTESIAGVFAEHTYNYLDKLTIVSGLRVDAHNLFGMFATPRLHIRYVPFGKTTMRFSVGRAQRTASVLTENQHAYFSSRKFVFEGASGTWQKGLLPEVAWNIGTSLTQPFTLNYRKGTVMLDYYYSWFTKQIIADYETPRLVKFYQLAGHSYSRSLQAQVDYEAIRKQLDIRIAYRFYDIGTKYKIAQMQRPLVSAHRAFLNVAYSTKTKWKFDYTFAINGSKRLPNTYINHATDSNFHMVQSPVFVTMNAHVSKQVNQQTEVYIGGENLTNYMQHNAIIGAANPFGKDFDASQTWGPIMGINGYVGIRWIRK